MAARINRLAAIRKTNHDLSYTNAGYGSHNGSILSQIFSMTLVYDPTLFEIQAVLQP